MPSAWAPIVTRVWSRVRMAVWKPVPGSPTIRSAGIQQLSNRISRVGEPWMPSLRSGVARAKPGSSACTTNAEIPLGPMPGSVTAITV